MVVLHASIDAWSIFLISKNSFFKSFIMNKENLVCIILVKKLYHTCFVCFLTFDQLLYFVARVYTVILNLKQSRRGRDKLGPTILGRFYTIPWLMTDPFKPCIILLSFNVFPSHSIFVSHKLLSIYFTLCESPKLKK